MHQVTTKAYLMKLFELIVLRENLASIYYYKSLYNF